VHAADLAEALVAVGGSAATVGGTYTACHPQVFTTAEFGSAVGAAMGPSGFPASSDELYSRLPRWPPAWPGRPPS
jgi:uncharacterized protein YbjT (DUF2867 family)